MPPQPPPPPPPPTKGTIPAPAQPGVPQPPAVPTAGPPGAFKLELMVFNGAPFQDHWAFWIPTSREPDLGVAIHVIGDVWNGFTFQAKRSLNLKLTSNRPSITIPLQWVNGKFFNEKAMLNNGTYILDNKPACTFEVSTYKAKPPTKSLSAVDDVVMRGRPVKQRNCQAWIVEAAAHLVHDGVMTKEVAAYLNAIKQ